MGTASEVEDVDHIEPVASRTTEDVGPEEPEVVAAVTEIDDNVARALAAHVVEVEDAANQPESEMKEETAEAEQSERYEINVINSNFDLFSA